MEQASSLKGMHTLVLRIVAKRSCSVIRDQGCSCSESKTKYLVSSESKTGEVKNRGDRGNAQR